MPSPLCADPGEVGGQAVEVVLAPDLERMMMALGAFQPDAEEQLADDRRDLVGRAAIAKERGRAVAPGAPLGRDQLADELVVGHVLAKRVANPGVEGHGRLDAHAIGIGPQQVGPLVGPEVGVLGPIEQRVDQLLALGRRRAGQKRAGFVGGRQAADHVEIGAPQKGRIRGRLARQRCPAFRACPRRGRR